MAGEYQPGAVAFEAELHVRARLGGRLAAGGRRVNAGDDLLAEADRSGDAILAGFAPAQRGHAIGFAEPPAQQIEIVHADGAQHAATRLRRVTQPSAETGQ